MSNRSHPRFGQYMQDWTTASRDTLKGCFECTDWSVFEDTASTASELANTVCSYRNFCVETVIPRKQVKTFLNNKPLVTNPVKEVLNRKRRGFRERGTKTLFKRVYRKNLKGFFSREGRRQKEVRVRLEGNNMKQVWEGLNLIGGGAK